MYILVLEKFILHPSNIIILKGFGALLSIASVNNVIFYIAKKMRYFFQQYNRKSCIADCCTELIKLLFDDILIIINCCHSRGVFILFAFFLYTKFNFFYFHHFCVITCVNFCWVFINSLWKKKKKKSEAWFFIIMITNNHYYD